MHPVLFHVFGHPIHAYPALLAVGFVAGTLLAVREADRRNIWFPPEIGLWIFLGALLGAKIFWIIQYDSVWHVWRAIRVWEAGLVFYGGLIGGVVAALLYTTIHRIHRRQAADLMVPYLALGQAITRVGCFLNGCCYGDTTSAPWAVQYPPGSHAFQHQLEAGLLQADAPCSLGVHPAPLYMVGGLLLIAGLLKYTLERRRFHGQVAILYAILYGALRFIVEGLRGDSARSVFGMTVSQTISLSLVALGLALATIAWRRGMYRRPRLAPEPTPEDAGGASEKTAADKRTD